MNSSEIAVGYPTFANETQRDLTFAGALRKYIFHANEHLCLSSNWNIETQERYIGYYENLLLPSLPKYKALKDYDDDDFQSALSALPDKYGESSISRFSYLLWIVYKAGVNDGEYEDHLLWRERGKTNDNLTVDEAARFEMTPKSLSIEAEIRLIEWFKNLWNGNILSIKGQSIGLMLMFCFGLRNNEACGINFGDIKVQENCGEKFPCLYISKSTVLGSNDLKMSGKTRNAARIIPMLDFMNQFICERKTAIEGLISSGQYNVAIESIDDLPLVCKGTDYSNRCSSSDITEEANRIFKELGITDKYRTAGILDTIFKQKLKEFDISEANPTSYLLRRNCATHLYGLGLSAGQIQYLIGHDIESTDDNRNFRSNLDDLLILYHILSVHPFNVFFGKRSKDINLSQKGFHRLHVKVVAEEPMDVIHLTLNKGTSMTVSEGISDISNGYPENINFKRRLIAIYDEKQEK